MYRYIKANEDPDDLYKIARSPYTRANTLDRLADYAADYDVESRIRIKAAIIRNLNVSEDTLDKLSRDQDPVVRACVVLCRKTPDYLVDRCADDESSDVRAAVALRTTSIDVLQKLHDDRSRWVRICVIKNTNVTIDILRAIMKENKYDTHLVSEARSKAMDIASSNI